MSENPVQVELGDRTYVLKPQKIGRIGRKLGAVIDMFAGMSSGQNQDMGARLYEALKVFIPDLEPAWRLAGYASEGDFKARERWVEEVKVAQAQFVAEHGSKAEGAEISEDSWDDLPVEVQMKFEPPDFVDPYDEQADNSPTPNQLMDAVETIFALHGGQRMVRLLKNFVSPEMIRAQIQRMQVEAALARSRSLQPVNGASGPTTSTTPDPTSAQTDGLASLQAGS